MTVDIFSSKPKLIKHWFWGKTPSKFHYRIHIESHLRNKGWFIWIRIWKWYVCYNTWVTRT